MASFKFSGFATASSVALSVAQSGQSADVTVANWNFTPGSQQGTVSIEIERHDPAISPAQIWVKAVDHAGLAPFEESGTAYDGSHHEYYHIWRINGEPLPNFDAPENMLQHWNNPNAAYGREAAFCISLPDSYIIELLVIDRNGDSAVAASSAFSVISPEDHFVDEDRIYVDLDGAFPGKPENSIGVDSLDGLKATLETAPNPPWVLFERGEIYDFGTLDISNASGTGWLRISSARPLAYISAYGSGPRPIFRPSRRPERNQISGMLNFWNTTPTSHVVIRDISFEGDFDPSTETGSPGQGSCISIANTKNSGSYFTFSNLKMDGIDKGFQLLNSGTNLRIMICNCDITNWRDYAVFGGQETAKLAIVGNKIVQNVEATHGGDKGDALIQVHAPIRISEAESLYIAQNDIFSRCGWSSGTGGRADQPCLRLFTVPSANQVGTIERNVLEGGYHIINHESANPSASPSTPGNVVFEQNLMIATPKTTGTFISSWRSGVTIRNNYMHYPSGPTLGSGTEAIKFALDGIESDDNTSNPIRIHSNTYHNAMSDLHDEGGAFSPFVNRNNRFLNYTEENNLWHKPLNSNAIDAGNVDLSTNFATIQPRFAGVRYGFDLPEILLPAGGLPFGATLLLSYSLFTQTLQDGTQIGDNTTNQTYWETNGGPKHAVYVYGEQKKFFAADGHFEVVFDTSEVRLTNTSGIGWGSGGEKVRLHLDRVAAMPVMDETYRNNNPISILRPQPGTVGYRAATVGLWSPIRFIDLGEKQKPGSHGAIDPLPV